MKEKYIMIDEDGIPKLVDGPLEKDKDVVAMWECGMVLIIRISDLKIMTGDNFENVVWLQMDEYEQTQNETFFE